MQVSVGIKGSLEMTEVKADVHREKEREGESDPRGNWAK